MFKAHQLVKTYRDTPVVNGLSIEVSPQKIVGLLGPNGAGKTTCFYMMVGLVNADTGRIFIDDQDITHAPINERAHLGIGYLPQEASVFRTLSVRENILAILELRPNLSRTQRLEQSDRLMEEFRLTPLRDSKGLSLSGGERRRVEIARLMARQPRYILLDEPFSGVDPVSITETKHMIRKLSDAGVGVLITDHNVRETLDICDEANIVHNGQCIARGPAETILRDPQVRTVYLGNDFQL